MVEAEGKVEGGVAVPGTFGIEKHRPGRADQDVLGAHVSMDQGEPGRRRFLHDPGERAGEVGMGAGGGLQIGLQADGVEDPVGGEAHGDVVAPGGAGVDGGDRGGDIARVFGVGPALAQLLLP